MKLAEAPEASGAADKSKHLVKAIQTNTYHSTPKSIKKQLKKLYVKWVQKKNQNLPDKPVYGKCATA